MDNGNMPAEPVDRYTITEDVQIKGAREGKTSREYVEANGLTKREAFAMAAMQGILTSTPADDVGANYVVDWAIKCADTLLKALEEEK